MTYKKRVLITGAAGRLGRVLCESLKNQYQICATDVVPFKTDLEYVLTDITDFNAVLKVVKGVDAIVHVAAILPPQSEVDREKTMRVNLEGTRNILRAAEMESKVMPFVFTSSVVVYGIEKSFEPITISHRLSATDIYSESKIASEELIKKSNVAYKILRVTGVYSPERMELPAILQFSKEQKVEFIALEDVVSALKSSINKDEAEHKVFNIAGGESWRMTGQEFINRMYGALGIEVKANFSPTPTYFGWYDTAVSNKILGYQKTSFNKFLENVREMGKKLGFL